ncbi:MAG: hypothetical protein HFI48_07555 [Lachnospiraceae bacterium]|nr:hypothetical protein [Lachnospiraceae bacterium]
MIPRRGILRKGKQAAAGNAQWFMKCKICSVRNCLHHRKECVTIQPYYGKGREDGELNYF